MDHDKVFFTSDTHIGHRNILNYGLTTRPFTSIEEHDEALINNWNKVVTNADHIYHLGDFIFKGDIEAILTRLKGQKHLIFGNHDHKIRHEKYKKFFQSTHDYKEIKVQTPEGEQRIVLMHFPIESWHKRHRGAIHLHGHCHGNLPSPEWQRRVDVGVDVWNCTPVSYAQIAEHMKTKTFKAIDHHTEERE